MTPEAKRIQRARMRERIDVLGEIAALLDDLRESAEQSPSRFNPGHMANALKEARDEVLRREEATFEAWRGREIRCTCGEIRNVLNTHENTCPMSIERNNP